MAIKITLKNSVVQDSVPTTSHLAAVGELALNANINSLGIYMRASDNSIVKMAGPGSVTTPAASTTAAGIAELATSAETTTGTDTARVTTPAGVKAVIDAERTTSNNTYLAKAGGTLTGVVAATAGSNSAPAIHFGDSDSGIYGGTNTVSLAAGGTQGLTLDSSANVSIPTSISVGSGANSATQKAAFLGGYTLFENSAGTGNPSITFNNDTDTGLLNPGANILAFNGGGSERARIDSSGRLLVGTSSSTSPIGWNNNLQVAGTSAVAGISIRRDEASTGGALLVFGKSRGSLNGNTTVIAGDQIGGMYFAGADGTDVNSIAAQISAEVEGTIAGNRMPGRLLFKTTADSAGSVSPTTRLTIDSAGVVNVPDNGKFTAGASSDLSIYHDGTNSHINNTTGYIVVGTDSYAVKDQSLNEFYIKALKDGGVELYYDGSKKFETTSSGVAVTGVLSSNQTSGQAISIGDNAQINLGNGDDLQIYHNGSHSFIQDTGTGNLYIDSSELRVRNGAGDELQIKATANASAELYYDGSKKFETTSGGVKVTGIIDAQEDVYLRDNKKLYIGDGSDLQIYHDGSHSYLKNTSGVQFINGNTIYMRTEDSSEDYFRANQNGSVELYYDGSKKLHTVTGGVYVTGNVYANNTGTTAAFSCTDNGRSAWGSDNDLVIYHDGSHTRLNNATGNFNVQTGAFVVTNVANTENILIGTQNGAVELYYDNSKKFETTSIGTTITGSLTIDNSNYDGLIVKNNDDGSNGAYITLINDSASPSNADIAGIVNFRGKDSAGNDTTYGQIKSYTTDVTDGQESGEMTFNVRNANTFEEKVRITAAGAVGIGTDNPRGSSNYQGLELNGTSGGVVTFSVNDVEKWNLYGESNFGIYDRVNSRYNLKCLDDGDVELPTGNLKLAANKGIMFNPHDSTDSSNTSTGTYGSDSNLLDDYEEGSANITVYFGTTDGSDITYTSSNEQRGWYTKIGRFVHVNGAIGLANKGSGTGGFYFKGLPFATSNKTGSRLGGVITYADNFVGVGSDMHLYSIQNNSNKVYVYRYDSDGNSHVLSNSHIANNTTLRFSLTYMAD